MEKEKYITVDIQYNEDEGYHITSSEYATLEDFVAGVIRDLLYAIKD
jgi:hypothetical protein